jgi:hypothetical protein
MDYKSAIKVIKTILDGQREYADKGSDPPEVLVVKRDLVVKGLKKDQILNSLDNILNSSQKSRKLNPEGQPEQFGQYRLYDWELEKLLRNFNEDKKSQNLETSAKKSQRRNNNLQFWERIGYWAVIIGLTLWKVFGG